MLYDKKDGAYMSEYVTRAELIKVLAELQGATTKFQPQQQAPPKEQTF